MSDTPPVVPPLWSDEDLDVAISSVSVWVTSKSALMVHESAVWDIAKAVRDEMQARIAELERKVAYYEAPLPRGEDGRYEITCDHRFTDEGTCVRCGEDAEDWDAGCVEQLVNEMVDLEKEVARLKASTS